MTSETKSPAEALAATIADFKADPSLRIRNYLAKDAQGRPVDPLDPSATCFCAIGRYVFHRNAAGPFPVGTNDQPYFQMPVVDGLVHDSLDIWHTNDLDDTEAGEEIVPVLEGILERLKAGEPLEPTFA